MKILNFITLILKVLKFLNITKTGVIKNIDHNPINSRNYDAAYHQNLEEVPRPLLPGKIQKHEKFAEKIFKNCLNS